MLPGVDSNHYTQIQTLVSYLLDDPAVIKKPDLLRDRVQTVHTIAYDSPSGKTCLIKRYLFNFFSLHFFPNKKPRCGRGHVSKITLLFFQLKHNPIPSLSARAPSGVGFGDM